MDCLLENGLSLDRTAVEGDLVELADASWFFGGERYVAGVLVKRRGR